MNHIRLIEETTSCFVETPTEPSRDIATIARSLEWVVVLHALKTSPIPRQAMSFPLIKKLVGLGYMRETLMHSPYPKISGQVKAFEITEAGLTALTELEGLSL